MAKNLKAMLTQKLSENNQRHASAVQDADFDAGRQHTKIAYDLIDPNPYQPRLQFGAADLEMLAASIAEVGLLQPISVRQVGARYQIIAGERRWRAGKILGRASIEAIVIAVDDADMAILGLVENIDRKDLTDYEIGKSLRRVEHLFPTKKKLAESLGMSREDMYRYYAFESLPVHLHARMDLRPDMLSRSAAADIKRVLNLHAALPKLSSLLDEVWNLLENGEIEQTKVAAYLSKLCLEIPTGYAAIKERTMIRRNGKEIGSVSTIGPNMVIKLKTTSLSTADTDKLHRFVQALTTNDV